MDHLTVEHVLARDVFLGQLDRFVETLGALTDHELLAASRCHGWSRLEVLVHVRTGLQELLGGVVTSTDLPPDTDAASYWAAWQLDDDDSAGSAGSVDSTDDVDAILWTRRTASAYRRPSGAMEHLCMVADGLRTSVATMPPKCVAFQGHVLTSGDLLATWAVELAVHQLDLAPGVASPTAGALDLARTTVERCLGDGLPADWTGERVVLLGTGRVVASEAERDACPAVTRLPVFG